MTEPEMPGEIWVHRTIMLPSGIAGGNWVAGDPAQELYTPYLRADLPTARIAELESLYCSMIDIAAEKETLIKQLRASNEKYRKALEVLAPFKIVRGDTMKRTNPHATRNLNTNEAWAVSQPARSVHSLRRVVDDLNAALAPTAKEVEND